MRLKTGFVHIALLFAFFSGTGVASRAAQQPPCERCRSMQTDLSRLQSDESHSKRLLAANKAMLDKLSASEISKRVKLSSNIYLINVRLELLARTISGKTSELQRMECTKCQGRPQETR